jgi:hypothetical protein
MVGHKLIVAAHSGVKGRISTIVNECIAILKGPVVPLDTKNCHRWCPLELLPSLDLLPFY